MEKHEFEFRDLSKAILFSEHNDSNERKKSLILILGSIQKHVSDWDHEARNQVSAFGEVWFGTSKKFQYYYQSIAIFELTKLQCKKQSQRVFESKITLEKNVNWDLDDRHVVCCYGEIWILKTTTNQVEKIWAPLDCEESNTDYGTDVFTVSKHLCTERNVYWDFDKKN